ncbi:MAG: N-methyl-L-tryptophan oxidase [Phycisphaerales bacterium]|nr:N-methyl-L-tryptophan oxidase [Phycisphaerales bacterium]
MRKAFDAAVLGLGTMGSLACRELARRGASVIGLDRFTPPHEFGSHSGDTRIFRTAYAEHPDYVPLARLSGELWDRYGEEGGTRLLTRCGMLTFGPAGHELLKGTRVSAHLHSILIEELDAAEIRRRYPAIELLQGWAGIFEPAAGWIDVNAAIRFGIEDARRAGAEIRLDCTVVSWDARPGEIRITTESGEFRAKRLVVTAGAWASALLPHLPITIEPRVLLWVRPLAPELFAPGRIPIFLSAERFLYGFPDFGGRGVKIGVHWVDAKRLQNPAELAEPRPEDLDRILDVAFRFVPRLAGPLPGAHDRVMCAKSCLYAMTPDEHFIVDQVAGQEEVCFAAGFSGHGFKFAPAIAVALADLALEGRTALPIAFLSQSRFGKN